jgi:hypothetical protein
VKKNWCTIGWMSVGERSEKKVYSVRTRGSKYMRCAGLFPGWKEKEEHKIAITNRKVMYNNEKILGFWFKKKARCQCWSTFVCDDRWPESL